MPQILALEEQTCLDRAFPFAQQGLNREGQIVMLLWKEQCGVTKFCWALRPGVAQRRDLHDACQLRTWTEDSVKGQGMVLSQHVSWTRWKMVGAGDCWCDTQVPSQDRVQHTFPGIFGRQWFADGMDEFCQFVPGSVWHIGCAESTRPGFCRYCICFARDESAAICGCGGWNHQSPSLIELDWQFPQRLMDVIILLRTTICCWDCLFWMSDVGQCLLWISFLGFYLPGWIFNEQYDVDGRIGFLWQWTFTSLISRPNLFAVIKSDWNSSSHQVSWAASNPKDGPGALGLLLGSKLNGIQKSLTRKRCDTCTLHLSTFKTS